MLQRKVRVSFHSVLGLAMASFAGVVLSGGATPARGDLILQVLSSSANAGGTGSFDVVLEETNGGTDAVSNDSVELSVSSGTGISFTAADTNTDPVNEPYIYGSLQSPQFTGDSFPNTQVTAADSDQSLPFQTVLNDGDVVGLAHVTYSVASGTPTETVPVSLISAGTSLADISDVPIDFTPSNGNITVTGAATSHSIISLTPGGPAAYGSVLGNLVLTGSHGSYAIAQVTGLSTATGYVEVGVFNPGNDVEVYGVDVRDASGQASGTELAEVLSAIAGDGIVPDSAGVTASDSVAGTNPYGFSSNYNLYIVASPGVAATDFFGIDLSSANDSNLSGLTFAAIAAVPEPMSLGVVALGGMALLAPRNRRTPR